ncbi:CehA/McbA family metallohydrolase [Microbispora sp. GKU 823]|uniref:CehA/McbA family metallohydrolase n=1 Tax=Microbispora sp. GKU 823 TaxID=1652100 RepID=UPI0009CC437C|nr:CehA/McbA family metallohydrolase [Microbispora sp. GKU 823]OPG06393.1 hypothetical protein B1L11_33060 [Microbispora sp. GKU 823]
MTTATVLTVDGEPVDLSGLARPASAARLRLRAGFPCRWSVTSADGQGWYPEGVPERRDNDDRPFFHGDDIVLAVPCEPVTIRVSRGMEYGVAETTVVPRTGEETLVGLAPQRLYDAAARGWYGADLHVHMNWAGDLVAVPAEAAAAQLGEDLHVLNLVAGNVAGDRVYDREALQHWAGRDLPWSDAGHVARMGVEYRNDLFGHVHVFGVAAPPAVYHTGFGADADWPPNAAVCGDLREPRAVLGYAHPFHGPVSSPEDVAANGTRNCTGRALVVDAALGLVDGVEVLHFSDLSSAPGTAEVYRRLVGAGNRLAALAGTDTMLSFTRQDTVSSPPGWERVYARVDGPLSAESFAEAVRRGRTFATTGPWLELTVDGLGPGETLDLEGGETVAIRARASGLRWSTSRSGRRPACSPRGPATRSPRRCPRRTPPTWSPWSAAAPMRAPRAGAPTPTPARSTWTCGGGTWPGRRTCAGACGGSTCSTSWSGSGPACGPGPSCATTST